MLTTITGLLYHEKKKRDTRHKYIKSKYRFLNPNPSVLKLILHYESAL